MSIAYGLGPNNNICCMIPSNGGEELYDIGEIFTGPPENQEERRLELLKIVSANGPIQHTHVIKLAQELCSIAKRTIEKELKNLEEDGLLESEKEGESYSNGSRRWSIKSPEHEFEKGAKCEAKNLVADLEKYVSIIEKHYDKFNSAWKAWAMTNLFQVIHSYQPCIEVINQETKIKNEKKEFDLLVKRAYNILKNENRDKIDGRPMLRRLLQLKASEPYTNMKSFVSQIKSKKK